MLGIYLNGFRYLAAVVLPFVFFGLLYLTALFFVKILADLTNSRDLMVFVSKLLFLFVVIIPPAILAPKYKFYFSLAAPLLLVLFLLAAAYGGGYLMAKGMLPTPATCLEAGMILGVIFYWNNFSQVVRWGVSIVASTVWGFILTVWTILLPVIYTRNVFMNPTIQEETYMEFLRGLPIPFYVKDNMGTLIAFRVEMLSFILDIIFWACLTLGVYCWSQKRGVEKRGLSLENQGA